jgi:hypothetical protein
MKAIRELRKITLFMNNANGLLKKISGVTRVGHARGTTVQNYSGQSYSRLKRFQDSVEISMAIRASSESKCDPIWLDR